MFKIADKVIVIKSPYASVKNGTVSRIIDIKYHQSDNQFGKTGRTYIHHLYILDTKPCSLFRDYEIKLLQ